MTVHDVLEKALEDFLRADEDIRNLLYNHKELLWKPAPDKWSAAQCIEHIMVSNTRYFDALENKLAVPEGKEKNKQPYRPTFWGNLVYKAVDPDRMKSHKSKAPKIFNPQPVVEIPTLIARFEKSQQMLHGYMQKTMETDATKKIKSPVSWFITYSLADTMAILSKHEIRHFLQAKNVLALRG